MKNEYKVEETFLGTRTQHPSYGTLLFNRAHGGSHALFGSSIEHSDIITMKVYHADVTRSLHEDRVHGNSEILEVEMSYSQFAEAITSFGCGSGVPVTIRYTELDKEIPKCEFEDKRKQFTNEFNQHVKDTMQESNDLINEVSSLLNEKKTLTKADKENIIKKLDSLSQNIGSNIPFIAKQFNEQMDKTVSEAKGEIECFCQNKLTSIANAAIASKIEDVQKLKNPVKLTEFSQDMIKQNDDSKDNFDEKDEFELD